jgi:lipopolysaccharide heptosyltransferase II
MTGVLLKTRAQGERRKFIEMIVSKIEILKRIDSILGKMAVRLWSVPCQQVTGTSSFLLIRPGGIGDAVLLAPALRALRRAYPEATIDLLAERRNCGIFSLVPEVNKVFHYDAPRELMAALRRRYDVVIDTEQWHRLSAVVARLTGAQVSIGFATNERSRLFTHQIPYSQDEYESISFFNLLMHLGITNHIGLPASFLSVPENAMQRGEELLGELSVKSFITIFPGGSIHERRWGADRFKGLAGILNAEGFPVVVIGGKEDAAAGEIIITGNYGINLAGKSSLVETASVIAKSAVLVSGDSGILHVGVGLGRPTVSLFGPGIAKKWAPRGEKHIVINKNLPCSPCTKFGYTPKCPIFARCMVEITVDEVAVAVKNMISRGMAKR